MCDQKSMSLCSEVTIFFVLVMLGISYGKPTENKFSMETANHNKTMNLSHFKIDINENKLETPDLTISQGNDDTYFLTQPIHPDWGGNCTQRHWDRCKRFTKIWNTTYLVDKKQPDLGYTHHATNCTDEPPLCLRNGWTVSRCQLLCMRCNREIFTKYDKFVAKEGACSITDDEMPEEMLLKAYNSNKKLLKDNATLHELIQQVFTFSPENQPHT